MQMTQTYVIFCFDLVLIWNNYCRFLTITGFLDFIFLDAPWIENLRKNELIALKFEASE